MHKSEKKEVYRLWENMMGKTQDQGCKVVVDTRIGKEYFPMMHGLIIIIVAAFLVVLPFSAGAEEFTLPGVEFPSIKTENWLLEVDTVLHSRYPWKFDILFYLSSEGAVDSFTYAPKRTAVFVKKVARSLNNIQFNPARINDLAISFVLPAELIFESQSGQPHASLRFPFEKTDDVEIRPLIEKGLILSGFALPGIKRFPSYFCSFAGRQDIRDYTYAVFEITLHPDGSLDDFGELFTNQSNFSDMMSRVLLYTDFRPFSYMGRNFPSKFYAIFRFFSTVHYPAGIWPPTQERGVHLPYDYLRIEAKLFLDSIVNPPFPTNMPKGVFKYDLMVPFVDSLVMLVKIDTLGRIISQRYRDFVSRQLIAEVERVVTKLKFTPAKDILGNKRIFEGDLFIVFNNSKRIRIVAEWLPREAQKPLQQGNESQ